MAAEPELSVVIAVIAGGQEAMAACLSALANGATNHAIECIVPYDARLDALEQLRQRFPWVDFIDARGQVDATRFGAFSREHHDILRAIGLRHARGRIVALLEDHGTPAPEWCDAVLAAHRGSYAAVGGAVENGIDRVLNWAVYYCDFGRYQKPVPDGPTQFLSDSNIAYKREALESVKDLWHDAFHETSVNWELRRRGAELRLDPRMVVYQTRRNLRLLPALRERYVWGRSFAGTRTANSPFLRRVMFAAASSVLPALLCWRIVIQALQRRRHLGPLLRALPLIVLLETIWAAGECAGYLFGLPRPHSA